MSRCFPYNRNGATIEALINPIKLRKEKSEKSKGKAERKEEKRANKEQKRKEKEKRKEEEKRTVQKSLTVDSRKALTTSELIKTSELSTEQRERSDLTEEHGQPISSQQPSYSSDSTQNTQNSNKRKRDDAVLPDGSGGIGKQLKIRLLKKPRGPEPGLDSLLSNVGRVETPVHALNSVQVPGFASRNLVTSNGRTSVPTTSGRENVALQARQFSQTISSPSSEISRMEANELHKQHVGVGMKQTAPSSVRPVSPKHLKHEVPSSNFNKTGPLLSQSRQKDVKLGQLGRQQLPTSSQQGRQVVPQGRVANDIQTNYKSGSNVVDVSIAPSLTRRSGGPQVPLSFGTAAVSRNHVECEIPRLNVQTGPTVSVRTDVQWPHLAGQQQAGIPKIPASDLQCENISNASVLGKRFEMTVSSVNGPSRRSEMVGSQKVGPTVSEKGKEVPVAEVSQKAGPTRLEKKMMKKNSKYEKLIGSWVPMVMAPSGGGGEEDWLLKKGDRVKTCAKDVDMHQSAAPSLWQPCARYLVDADVYAMPYTVPF